MESSRFIESAIAAMPDNHAKQESPGNKANDGEGKLTEATMSNRDVAGLAVACWAAKDNCVDIIRVHDVKVRSTHGQAFARRTLRGVSQPEWKARDFVAVPALAL